jgi:hypothetical protein
LGKAGLQIDHASSSQVRHHETAWVCVACQLECVVALILKALPKIGLEAPKEDFGKAIAIDVASAWSGSQLRSQGKRSKFSGSATPEFANCPDPAALQHQLSFERDHFLFARRPEFS